MDFIDITVIGLVAIFGFYFLFALFSKKNKKEEEVVIDENGVNLNEVFNVENFNTWFNDTSKSPDIYAHPGIFLRTDKLSGGHFEDYFDSIPGIENGGKYYDDNHKRVIEFEDEVREDWFKKLGEQ